MKRTYVVMTVLAALALAPLGAWAQAPPNPPKPPKPPKPPEVWHQTDKDAERGPERTERIERTFKVGDGAMLVLANVSGDIAVSAAPGAEIRVEAVKRTRIADEDEAKRQLEATRVEFSERPGSVEVRAEPRGRHNRVSVSYTATVPPATRLEVRSVSGDVSITAVKGEVQAETVSGTVKASGLGPRAMLKAVSGDIAVSQVEQADELRVETVSGDVLAKAFKAKTVDAGSVSGSVRLLGGSCDRALVRSVSGDIEVDGGVVKGGRYTLKTHSGDVRLFLDGKVGFALEADTFSGNIKTDLPLTMVGDVQEGHGPRRNVRGTFGDGAAQIEASSFSGSVIITKR
jgi:hypothetical protein